MGDHHKSEQEWKQILSDEEYRVCRQKGTEPPFSGIYTDCKDEGIYRCRCCQAPLFKSDTKYNSGCGWPSFWAPVSDEAIKTEKDTSHGMVRVEVMCAHCGAHLGHVFPDGPQATGLRYCINSVSLDLDKD